MSRGRQRADRIRDQVSITQVLQDYGYTVHAGYDGEQQFSCDLHGDGQDSKPSARVYPDSGSWYCFACDRTRDAIQTTREKEGLDFWGAVKALESRYGLGRMVYEEEAEQDRDPAQGFAAEIKNATTTAATSTAAATTWENEQHRAFRFLDGLTLGKDLPLGSLLKLWEAYDKVCYLVDKEMLTEDKAKAAISKVREKAMEMLKGKSA